MNTTHLAATLALAACSLLAVGCGGDKSSSTSGAAATGSPSPAATAAAAGGKVGVVATCNKKGVCSEYRNAVPDLSEDLCKGTDGTFVKGSTGCPSDKLLGTCVNKLTPDTTTFWYGGAEEAELDKGLCEALDGKWTVAAAPKAVASAAPAAPAAADPKGAPAAKTAAKAAPPAKAAPKKK